MKDFSDLASALESNVTIIALVVGAVWAYYKFIKDRIYRPRFDLAIDAGTLSLGGRRHLLCRVSVKNIGTSKIRLLQEGTGLQISTSPPVTQSFALPAFTSHGVFNVFTEHEWIESKETIRHELLVGLPSSQEEVCLFEVRLVCEQPRRNVVVRAHRLVTTSMPWSDGDVGKGLVMTRRSEQQPEDKNESSKWERDKQEREAREEHKPPPESQAPEDKDETDDWERGKEGSGNNAGN